MMSSSDCLVTVGHCFMQESFSYLRALWNYALKDPGNESSIYGAFENLHLGSFPQKDLKISKTMKDFRAPDFTIFVVQSGFGQESTQGKIEDMAPLIWEVKASLDQRTWFGEGSPGQLEMADSFMRHFHQIAAQVVYAKAKFNQKPIHILLSINVWFVLLYFPGNPPSVVRSKGKKCKIQLDPAEFRTFYNHIAVAPARMFNEDCTAFSPAFLYALQLSVKDLVDVTVTLHPSFRAPEGTAELISAELEKYRFSGKLEEEGRRAEIENKFVFGEEDTDERSTGWSACEEPETDIENQKHPTAVPATLDHFLTSPAKTRSKATALKSRAPAKASTQLGPLNEGVNIAGPSRTRGVAVVNPVSVGKARLQSDRPRRKAAEKTIGYKKDAQPVGDD